MGGVSNSPVRPGELVGGKYRIQSVLGQGGMGVVVRAFHEQLERPVAIKFLHPDMLRDAGATQRFEREARATARLKNDHVVDILDVGVLPSGAPYIVMEYLEGENLAATLYKTKTALSDSEIQDVMLQVCDAIADAHAAGIVHRDLKPQNIHVERKRDGRLKLKVLDFGISKMSEVSVITGTNDMLGSPHYMSPEQLLTTRDVTPAADIWALGIILYELVTRTKPFEGETLPAVCMQIISLPHPAPPPASRFAPIIDRCLQKKPEDRFPSVDQLASALRGDLPTIATPSLIMTQVPATVPHVPTPFQSTRPDFPPAQQEPNATSWGGTHAKRAPSASRAWIPILVIGAAGLVLGGIGLGVRRYARPPITTNVAAPPAAAPSDAPPPAASVAETPEIPAPIVPTSAAPSATTAAKTSRPRPPVKPSASTEDPDQLPTMRH